MQILHLKRIIGLLLIGTMFSCGASPKQQSTTDVDKKPLVVFVTGDHEYSSEATMPILAAELEKNYNMRAVVLKSAPDHNSEENIPGLEILKDADLVVFYLRWRRLPTDQLKPIDDYLKSGKPAIGFRTTTHGFNFPAGHPSESWNAFGEFAFGTPPGWGKSGHTHYGHNSSTDVSVIEAQKSNPILTGVPTAFHVRSWLYHVVPDFPPKGATALLMGKAVDPDKTAVDNPVAWTWKTNWGGKSFFTTLGHPDDFKEEGLQRLVINAIHWTLDKEVPKQWAGKMNINVPYRQ
ncbi:ThuA domain-containing protein [Sphingobacterium sp. SYP-B4668]|uniref:ThuA domain-containing protein n=1 Tax=Sphingobacterium sp. SYP-B4668 TaxID=2996035 RepID=UPI0022DE57DB|nr:ThuA domain-containing protein [Sphingobacterium sp. SYP-B4668]